MIFIRYSRSKEKNKKLATVNLSFSIIFCLIQSVFVIVKNTPSSISGSLHYLLEPSQSSSLFILWNYNIKLAILLKKL